MKSVKLSLDPNSVLSVMESNVSYDIKNDVHRRTKGHPDFDEFFWPTSRVAAYLYTDAYDIVPDCLR